jgi:hypothetical protein
MHEWWPSLLPLTILIKAPRRNLKATTALTAAKDHADHSAPGGQAIDRQAQDNALAKLLTVLPDRCVTFRSVVLKPCTV